jgi:hypothetical protein
VAQLVAHHTVNGCNLRAGDLFGSGTLSGPKPEQGGSLVVLSASGRRAGGPSSYPTAKCAPPSKPATADAARLLRAGRLSAHQIWRVPGHCACSRYEPLSDVPADFFFGTSSAPGSMPAHASVGSNSGSTFLHRRFPKAEMAYQTLKTINDPALIDEWLAGVVRSQLAAKLLSGLTPQPPSYLVPAPVFEAA